MAVEVKKEILPVLMYGCVCVQKGCNSVKLQLNLIGCNWLLS